MRLQLASDLHTETHGDRGAAIAKELMATTADVLVLAGDIASTKHPDAIRNLLDPLSEHYRHIVYVPGNHEFYGVTPAVGWYNLKTIQSEYENVHILDNEHIEIDGRMFLGGTGWFPWPNPMEDTAKQYMNDFYHIRNFEPWVYQSHVKFRALLNTELQPGYVVVTHHLPSSQSTPMRFRLSSINRFFVSDFENEIAEYAPALWMHGHTHTRCDYMAGQTRVVCNPLGYLSEPESQDAFDPGLIIDL